MGREVKRVPIKFDWPIAKVWGGYKNPFSYQSIECPVCEGSGSSPEAKRLQDQWYGNAPFKPEDRGSVPFKPSDPPVWSFAERNVTGNPGFYGSGDIAVEREANRLCELFNKAWSHHLNAADVKALVDGNRLWDFTRVWTDKGWEDKKPKYIPTPKEVNEWSLRGMGHDSCNQWICVDAECKRLGYKDTCEKCGGDGTLWPSEKIKRQHDRWKATEPPKGRGWQLWETVSEGSPISPVFSTPELLARWLMGSPDYTWRRSDEGTTYEQWMKFLRKGWAPSLISDGKTVMTGVQAVGS